MPKVEFPANSKLDNITSLFYGQNTCRMDIQVHTMSLFKLICTFTASWVNSSPGTIFFASSMLISSNTISTSTVITNHVPRRDRFRATSCVSIGGGMWT